jgi:adenine specific DNA methylase Mod
MRELLATNGVIVVHLDQKKGHYIKIILDELFTEGNFQNEIIWRYGKMSNAKRRFPQNHDTLLVYSKSDTFTFNQVKDSPSEYRARFIRYLTDNKVFYKSVKNSDDKLILGRIKKVDSTGVTPDAAFVHTKYPANAKPTKRKPIPWLWYLAYSYLYC